jgi:hypothetical protein
MASQKTWSLHDAGDVSVCVALPWFLGRDAKAAPRNRDETKT